MTSRADLLSEAEANVQQYERDLKRLLNAQDETPAEARRHPDEVAALHAEVVSVLDIARAACAEATTRRDGRSAAQKRLVKAAADREATAAARRRWDRLCTLLGPRGLQRALVRQAETVIAGHAADLVDQLSAGRLDLQLRKTSKADKALDLVVTDRDTEGRSLPVASLSGSQKFRVAVALALAIGRYASESGRPIEAVIIDEGFGGLDRDGLDAMVAALDDLQTVLRRILLVSHQQDFQQPLP